MRPPGIHCGYLPRLRQRHRGHRSHVALEQRSRRDRASASLAFLPPAGDSDHGKSCEESSFNQFSLLGFTVLLTNVQSINSNVKRALLSAHLERYTPDILALNETWLDSSVQKLDFVGYSLVSRRDRPNSKVGKLNHGGIAVFCRTGGVLVTHLEDSNIAERSWHVVHTDLGGVLFGVWYRPPASSHNHIETFDAELERLSDGMVGTLVVGDVNIWHKRWLKHSPADTLEGERLHTICKEHALKQLVSEPTRGPNLLDVALSSLNGAASASVVPAIADHKGVFVRVDLPAPKLHVIERTVWDYKKANWDGLIDALSEFDYSTLLNADVDSAVESFVKFVVSEAKQFIPTRLIREHKGTHPWLNDECRDAILHKQSREGSIDYKEASETCTQILRTAYSDYVSKIRSELRSLPKGSKRWWSLSKVLMDNAPSKSGIPSLRDTSGQWIHDGRGKADLLADVFCSKFALPDDVVDDPDLDTEPSTRMSSFVLIRERWVCKELSKLREDQATGIDGLPAKILRRCVRPLSRPITALIRKVVANGRWPASWKLHRMSPLFKKGVVHKPTNYRGLHLTPVVSKVAERVIKIPFGNYLEAIDAFGASQWAFRKKRSCTDLVLLLICSWLLAFQRRRKVGVFLGDISGAFDRVDAEKLLKKLRRLGVCDILLAFFEDFLAPRLAHVAVDGSQSYEFVLKDMVFPGTVLGPSLWNVFFADIHEPAEKIRARERRFADDLSVSKDFSRTTANEDVLDDMRRCQSDVHAWGVRNRVSFDPAKEEFAILASQGGSAEPFRLLGPLIDEKLLMHDCIDKLYRKAKPKARALLRCRRFYNTRELLHLFKAHVRSQIEWCNGAIYHASPSKLAWLDSVQSSFLCHLEIGEQQAFADHNLAPLRLRRDIGMLGVFWKICHGVAHPDFATLFPKVPSRVAPVHNTRVARRRHDMQLVDPCDGTQLAQFQRSLFGLVKVWNALPTAFVHETSVSSFQSKLAQASRKACSDNRDGWQDMFATTSLPHTLLVKYCFA